jgi:Skp family chaperone for outer membrane proteins
MNKSYLTGFLSGTSVVALGMVVVLLGSGFQGSSAKTGVVDAVKVMEAVETARNYREEEKNYFNDRENALQFLSQNRVMKKEDAEKFWNLTLKTTKTDAEKAELEKVKTSAADAKKKFNDLQVKANPTDADLKILDDYRNRQAEMGEFGKKLVEDTQTEMKDIRQKHLNALQDAYQAAILEIGKRDGYGVIFDKNVAPFAANDVTDAASKIAAKKG